MNIGKVCQFLPVKNSTAGEAPVRKRNKSGHILNLRVLILNSHTARRVGIRMCTDDEASDPIAARPSRSADFFQHCHFKIFGYWTFWLEM